MSNYEILKVLVQLGEAAERTGIIMAKQQVALELITCKVDSLEREVRQMKEKG